MIFRRRNAELVKQGTSLRREISVYLADQKCDPIVYFELPSTDLAASARFYEQAFGWTVRVHGESYGEWKVGDHALCGGFNPVKPGESKPQALPLAYIEVAQIEAKLAEIEAAGGRVVMPKTKISDEHGYYALFADPCGAVLGLWCKE